MEAVAWEDVEKKFRRMTVYIVYTILNFDRIFGENDYIWIPYEIDGQRWDSIDTHPE